MKKYLKMNKCLFVILFIVGVLIITTGNTFAFSTGVLPKLTTKNYTISHKINSYDKNTKKLSITAEIQVTATGDYEIETISSVLPQSISTSVSKNTVYPKKKLLAGQADIFNFTLDDLSNSDIYISYRNVISNEQTTDLKIFRNNDEPKEISPVGTAAPVKSLDGKQDLVFYFSNTSDHIVPESNQVSFTGYVQNISEKPQSAVFEIFLGKTPETLSKVTTIDLTKELVSEKIVEWKKTITELTPNTKYYLLFVNTLDKNPNTKNIGNTVFTFTTTGTNNADITNSNSLIENDPDSPAGSDNAGQGGVFSYRYPTNTGNPGSVDYNLDGADGQLVPDCSYGDISTRCSYVHLMDLVARIIKFGLVLLLPIIAIIAVYTGIQMIINRTNPIKLAESKKVFIRILIGIAVILLAWTIIASILSAVVNTDIKKILLLDLTGL